MPQRDPRIHRVANVARGVGPFVEQHVRDDSLPPYSSHGQVTFAGQPTHRLFGDVADPLAGLLHRQKAAHRDASGNSSPSGISRTSATRRRNLGHGSTRRFKIWFRTCGLTPTRGAKAVCVSPSFASSVLTG